MQGVIIYGPMRRVSVKEMQELDRRAIEEKGIPSIVLMENAGRKVAEEVIAKSAAIFCSTGNNGGDGFVAARHLAEKGIEVKVYIVGKRSSIKNDPKINLDKLNIGIKEIDSPVSIDSDIIIDAIFGIGLKGAVREPARSIIVDLNKRNIPILSIDVPSGLDATTGECQEEACINATKTITFGLAKSGFYSTNGQKFTGEIVIKNIGFPKSLLNHQPT